MTKRWISAAVLGLAMLAGPAIAAQDDELRALVKQLSAEDWKERERVVAKVAEFGDLALPHLRERLDGELDPQTRVTIETLLRRIVELEKSAPTRVTLKLAGVKGSEAMERFAKAAGITWGPGSEAMGGDELVDVDITRRPLWEALAEVGGKCGVTFNGLDDTGRILLRPVTEDAPAAPTWVNGPFMVTLSRVDMTVTRAKDFGGPRGLGAVARAVGVAPFRLYMHAWCEPRLKPLSFAIDSVAECMTDKGEMQPPNNRVVSSVSSLGRVNSRYETLVSLSGPPEKATKIERLRLAGRFVLQRKIETLEIADLMNGKEVSKAMGGFRVVVRGMAKMPADPTRYTYTMVIHRDGRSVEEWQSIRTMVYQFPAKVVDAKGVQLLAFGGSSSMSGDTLTFTNTISAANGQGEPSKLVWEFPTETHVAATEIEFKDVPLP